MLKNWKTDLTITLPSLRVFDNSYNIEQKLKHIHIEAIKCLCKYHPISKVTKSLLEGKYVSFIVHKDYIDEATLEYYGHTSSESYLFGGGFIFFKNKQHIVIKVTDSIRSSATNTFYMLHLLLGLYDSDWLIIEDKQLDI